MIKDILKGKQGSCYSMLKFFIRDRSYYSG